MEFVTRDTPKGAVDFLRGITAPIASAQHFLDILANCPSSTFALESQHLDKRFFQLETGLAGEILQKISNYHRRLIILGDFGSIERKSLRDFIRESNRGGKVVFAQNLEIALDYLR